MLTIAVMVPVTAWAAGVHPDSVPEYAAPPRPRTAPPPPPDTAFADAPRTLGAGLEQVAAIERWFDWMALEGSDASVLFGVPAPADKAAVQLGARSVLRLVQMATTRLDAGIEAHDKAEGVGEATDAEAGVRAVHARSVLLPLRAARAMLLTAALEPDGARRSKVAGDASRIAAAAEPVSPWADGERSLLQGVAGVLSGMGGPGGARESLDHLAAAKKAVTEDGAPRSLELELGDDIALAIVLGVSIAQPGVDSNALLARVLDQPAMINNSTARLIAAEVRLRLMSPSGLAASTSEAALGGFADEFARAERDGHSAPQTLTRLLALARTDGVPEGTGHTTVGKAGSVVGVLAALARFREHPDAPGVRALTARLHTLPESSGWRRIGLLTLLETPPGLPASDNGPAPGSEDDRGVRLALAHAAADGLGLLRAEADRRRALASARGLLAPLGPGADLDLSERVFVLSLDHGDGARVTSGPSEWGLKEVFEARAEKAGYEQAAALLIRSDELAPRFRCAECWWRLLDAMLRDADAVHTRAEMIDGVAKRTLDATRTWIADTPDAAQHPTTTGPGPGKQQISDDIERRIRPIYIDALLRLGEAEAVKSFNNPAETPPVRFESSILLDAASARESAAAARLLGSLGRLDDDAACEWTARLSDRAWARVRPLTLGFPSVPGDGQAANAAGVLGVLAGVLDRFPEASRGPATARCAWGLLLSGKGADAAEVFARAMALGGRSASLLRGLGESHLGAGNDADAFAAFREVAAGVGPEGDHARDYFHAWVRMLEILSRQNADGSKRETIAREVRRLRLLGPAKKCPECAERLEAVAAGAE